MALRFQFKPTLIGVVITLVCIPMFIKFGLWQYEKAQKKIALQAAYTASVSNPIDEFPNGVLTLTADIQERWHYKKVKLMGAFDTRYQILLDNQVEASRAGYHVLTPFKLKDVDEYVLVDRGWIPAKTLHTDTPTVETPDDMMEITGQVWIPSKKIFTLESKEILANTAFSTVWQHLDLDRYKASIPIKVSSLVIRLDPDVRQGGFVRNWQVPMNRIATHLGYAYQWFGFAVATLIIFLYMSVSVKHSAQA